jgi:hypothetical protein
LGDSSDVLRDLYEPWAFLRDVEQAAKLQALLGSISFTVPFDMCVRPYAAVRGGKAFIPSPVHWT